jgi:L-threonylcarbamoyladenylate synthase
VEPVRLRLGDLPEEETARRAAFVLRRGGIALLPAEGVYGFHAAASSRVAVGRIVRLKGRSDRAGFIGLIARPEDASRWARVEDAAERLIRAHWPGALTLVLDALPEAPAALRSADGTIALRCPGSSFLRAVVVALDAGPVVSTSANTPGTVPATRVEDAPPGMVELVVDGGALAGTPSTVVRVSGSGIQVLRSGAVAIGAVT